MKLLILNLAVLLLGLTLGMLAAAGRPRAGPPGPMTTNAAGPTLESVRALASLVTTTVTVSDVQVTELRGYTGATRAALLVRGDFQVGTDLSRATFTHVDPAASQATLILPTPVADRPRVDLQQTKLIALGSEGLWEIVPGHQADTVVTDAAYADAERAVGQVSCQAKWADQSERQTEAILRTFFGSIGWTVDVQWADR